MWAPTTTIGDHVAFHKLMLGRDGLGEYPAAWRCAGPRPPGKSRKARPSDACSDCPAPYLNGLESPADGGNIVRGLIRRGYSDVDVRMIIGGNAMDLFRRVIG